MATSSRGPGRPRIAEDDPIRLRMRAQYESGQFTPEALAKVYGCSVRHVRRLIKDYGWAIGATAKIVHRRTQERISPTEEAINEAVETNIRVIREHQAIAERGRTLAYRMLGEIEEVTNNLPEFQQVVALLTKKTEDDPSFSVAEIADMRTKMLTRLSTGRRATVLKDIAVAARSWIDIERIAFNLDGAKENDPEKWTDERLDNRIAELLRKTRAAAAAGTQGDEGEA